MTTMYGELVERDGVLCVKTETTWASEPKVTILWWRVTDTHPNSRGRAIPKPGNSAKSVGQHCWETSDDKGLTGHVTIPGNSIACFSETQDVPCPKVRKGIETRWRYGKWEKCLKAGWVEA